MIVMSAARASLTCGGRLFEILDIVPTIADKPNSAGACALTAGVLRFEHVDFEYDPGAPVLTDISFEVGRGKILGIVGPRRAAASRPSPTWFRVSTTSLAGAISIDGVDIRDVRP